MSWCGRRCTRSNTHPRPPSTSARRMAVVLSRVPRSGPLAPRLAPRLRNRMPCCDFELRMRAKVLDEKRLRVTSLAPHHAGQKHLKHRRLRCAFYFLSLSCTSSRWSKTLKTSTFSLRFFIFCQATLSEHATPMNPPHVELDTCGSLSLDKHSGFLNLCVKMPLGQNQSHTLRVTLAL